MSDQILNDAADWLTKLQGYDIRRLARTDLQSVEFGLAVGPAERLLSLFRLIPTSGLSDLPKDYLQNTLSQAKSVFNKLEEFANFDLPAFNGNLIQWRDDKVNSLRETHNSVATTLAPIISFMAARRTDFSAIESDARAVVTGITQERDKLLEALADAKAEADRIREAMKKAAAEVGVTQEAIHFQTQANNHEKIANNWLIAVIAMAAVLAAYAVVSIFMTRWDILAPRDAYETVQLAVSKILVFAVLGFVLITCVRNYSAHRHNAVVNRHRQNALQTFKALASAAHVQEAQDIVLTHAAACFYAPQETAYTRNPGGSHPSGVVEMLPRLAASPPVTVG